MTRSEHGCRITWLGHASILIEIDGARVLTDPVLRQRVGPLVRRAPPANAPTAVDVVLISHLHADHLDLPTLRRVRGSAVIAPVGAGRWLARHEVDRVCELGPNSSVSVAGLTIRAVPAVHDSRRYPLGVRGTPVGYVFGRSCGVYFAGDTDLYDGMADLHGQVTVALLPVSGWGPRVPEGHLDPLRAAQAAGMIRPDVAIPIHWGTYGLAWAAPLPDPSEPAQRFVELARRYAPGVEVRLLRPGGSTEIAAG
jgi:L-ascorbate metabolism protein UlaG (beta-lactamase superfamily)